jgi:hypothetical protein
MKESTRARVASIVGAAFKEKKINSVYDYASGKYRNTSVKVKGGKVNGYDYSSSSHYSGGGQGGKLDFYDYETSSHVQLKLDGKKYSGYDYHTGKHFSGTISGNSISLYDYETGQYYNYSF